jgi:hypothetical protein
MSVSLYGSGQTVIQVASTTVGTGTSFAITANTYQNFTGLSVSITPQSTTSKILIMVQTVVGNSQNGSAAIQVVRGGTAVGNSTGGSGINSISANWVGGVGNPTYSLATMYGQYLDSPSTTSSITYQVQVTGDSTSTYYFNRRQADATIATTSTITVMEIAYS